MRTPGPTLQKAWIEEVAALASFLKAQGFEDVAAQVREAGLKVVAKWRAERQVSA